VRLLFMTMACLPCPGDRDTELTNDDLRRIGGPAVDQGQK